VASLSELEELRARVVKIAAILVLAIAPITELPRLLSVGLTGRTITTLLMLVGATACLYFHRTRRIDLATAALLPPLGAIMLWEAAAGGVAGDTSFFWYGSFIMVTSLLAGARYGWAAAGIGLLGAPVVGWSSGTILGGSPSALVQAGAVFLITAGIFSGLEAAFTRAMGRRKDAESSLRRTNERYALAAEGAGYGAWEWDSAEDLFWLAPGVQAIRGLPAVETSLDREAFKHILHPEDVDRTFTAFQEHLGGGRTQLHVLFRVHHADGRWIWVEGHGASQRSEDRRSVRLFGSLRDVTARKLMEQALHRQAFYDELTGLPNRSLFLDRLHQTIRRARRKGVASYAVLFLDLDRFKIVNDSLGHDVGDLLLAEFGRRLAHSVRNVDTAARLGGDEFAVLLEGVGPGDVQLAVDRIQEELESPFELAGRELSVGASVGVLEGSLDYEDPREALRDADLAMYSAKGASHSVGRFRPSLRLEAQHRLDLDQAIIRGLERDEMEPWFQPMFDLRTGELRGFEALVRWRRSDGKLVWPDEFVPRAEETGAIARIDRLVVEKACFAAAAWNRDRRQSVELSVNISAWLFRDEELPQLIERILQRSGLDPTCLHLELTESTFLADVPGLDERLERLRNMGLRLAVDDFGTGYSSMSYLHRFRVHRIKIDRTFVQENGEAGPGPLCRAILGMADALGVDVVAEGIETEEQQRELLRLGCTQGQGWLLGRALPAAAAAELARDDFESTARTLQAVKAIPRNRTAG
jgi:diguanylate cyclase (GGDEF)-like protein/PAS domain S-box-containing protein